MDKCSKRNSIYRNKNYMLLITGKLVSNIGNAIHNATVIWFIMEIVSSGNTGKYLGIYGACALIPTILLSPFAGVFVDRIHRKKIIVITDLLRGFLILLLALIKNLGVLNFQVLILITMLNAFGGTFFDSAVGASIPNIVDKDDLHKANSTNGMISQLSYIIGTAISGFLYYYLGILGIFIINGISYILSGISELFIDIPDIKKDNSQIQNKPKFFEQFKEGIVFIKTQKAIMVLLGFILLINFQFGPFFQILLAKIVNFTLGLTAKEYGILTAVFSIGAILGMAIMSMITLGEKIHKIIIGGIIAMSTIMVAMGLPIILYMNSIINNIFSLVLLCILTLIMGIAIAFVNIPIMTCFHRLVPNEYGGRFWGMQSALVQGIIPLGLMIIGALSDITSPVIIVMVGGAVVIVLGVSMQFVNVLKEI